MSCFANGHILFSYLFSLPFPSIFNMLERIRVVFKYMSFQEINSITLGGPPKLAFATGRSHCLI